MKKLLGISLTLFSSLSFSNSGAYYCIGQDTFSYKSKSTSYVEDSTFFKPRKNKGVMKIDYENKSVTSKYLIDIDGCFVTEKNILRCASTLGGEFFSFNPNLNEYYLVEINDGDLDLPFVDHFINSSIGQCEKID